MDTRKKTALTWITRESKFLPLSPHPLSSLNEVAVSSSSDIRPVRIHFPIKDPSFPRGHPLGPGPAPYTYAPDQPSGLISLLNSQPCVPQPKYSQQHSSTASAINQLFTHSFTNSPALKFLRLEEIARADWESGSTLALCRQSTISGTVILA